jgi:hypothetical protein
MRVGKVFISYRRDDSGAHSGRLYDRLKAKFPDRVFRDVKDIGPGVQWDEAIARVLSQTAACLVVIGKNWLVTADAAGRPRLDDSRDVVRQEIAAALKRKMRVFPVLVDGAKMPAEADLPIDLRPLCRWNATELSEHYWDEGIEKLIKAIETALATWDNEGAPQSAPRVVNQAVPAPRSRPGWVIPAAGALLLALVVGSIYFMMGQHSGGTAGGGGTAFDFAGNWRAVVITPAQRHDEGLEVYPDGSLRFVNQNHTVAVGKWQYNSAADSLQATDATNLDDHDKYSCTWKNAGASQDALSGTCLDRLRNSWTVSLSRAPGSVSPRTYNVPRVDLSALTTAERAAFSQMLTDKQCGCGMMLLTCLRKHPACPFQQNLAQSILAAFLQVTHS